MHVTFVNRSDTAAECLCYVCWFLICTVLSGWRIDNLVPSNI